ncbi:hypothetical protein GGTG_09617 [Gaeumannomyces tritici R3-111a-1]|uniref:Uncharacterized protein n=1 Tax=Gaeumannomyces tritici (strain R3-111a-1) TaxID=644352 RepID=J3P7X7_GAET3|nr:hypothetical protein GGTG_09617 [Gaeumannomyces tritici R3-111a-1]EJT72760.1 hypothetical protein GGTG_09617 [Gaeumannomyces tritici R3-111a-1]
MRLSTILCLVAGDILGPTCDQNDHLPQPARQLPLKSAPPHGSPRIPRPTTGDATDSAPNWAELQVPGHERIPSAGAADEQVTTATDACGQKPTCHLSGDASAGHQVADMTTEARSSDGSAASRTGGVVIITQSHQPETTPPDSTANISSPTSGDHFLQVSEISHERKTVLWAGVAMGVVGLIMCSF